MEEKKNKSIKHGMFGTRQYFIWNRMKGRCRPNDNQHRDYYDRGIQVCEKWQNFVGFWEEMGDTYADNLTIERLDNNKGYCKENCVWATQYQQNLNKKSNRMVFYKGQHLPLKAVTDKLGLRYEKTRKRLNRGWSLEDALLR